MKKATNPEHLNGDHRLLWEEIRSLRDKVDDIATNALTHILQRVTKVEAVGQEQRWLLRAVLGALLALLVAVAAALATRAF